MRILMLLMLVGCGDDLPPPSGDLSVAVCGFATGRVCGYDTLGGCAADDGCNWCDCSEPGGMASCTLVACLADAGAPKRCQATSECPSGEVCAFDPGCTGEMGRCTSARECTSGSAASYCGCDGKTFTAAGPCADQPHAHAGGC